MGEQIAQTYRLALHISEAVVGLYAVQQRHEGLLDGQYLGVVVAAPTIEFPYLQQAVRQFMEVPVVLGR